MKNVIIIILSIVSIFFLTAQTCSFGTSTGLALECDGEGDIVCSEDNEAYECGLAAYGTGYYVSRVSEYDEDCVEEGAEEEAEEEEAEEDTTDTDDDSDDTSVADCSDTDGGTDYYTAGVVTYNDGSIEIEYTEYCEAGYDYTGTLTEYSCSDVGELVGETVTCAYGCADDYASCATEIPVDTTTDTDGDGLTDYDESTYGTYSDDTDSDDDGLSDGDEINGDSTYGYTSDPLDTDTDDDTISDYDEVMGTSGYFSDPASPDTNDDGIGDLIEITFGIDPQDTTMEDYLFFDLAGDSATAQYTGDDGNITGTVDIRTDDDESYGYLDGTDYLTVDIGNATMAGAERVIIMAHVLPDGEQMATIFGQNAVDSSGADTCDTTIIPVNLVAATTEYGFGITTDATTGIVQAGTVSNEWVALTGIWFADEETMYFYVDNQYVGERAGMTGSLLEGGTIQVGTSACGDPFVGGVKAAKIWID
jgi:hypothetical protein